MEQPGSPRARVSLRDGAPRPEEIPVTRPVVGADDGIRTRDPHLGKVVLYQLSHVRTGARAPHPSLGPAVAAFNRATVGSVIGRSSRSRRRPSRSREGHPPRPAGTPAPG